ncbi:MAG: metallophosphoesterase [Hyphomicrobiaceae bacterium]
MATASPMRIVQLSDSHISRDHPRRAAELEACVQYINATDPQPDAIIHTGDIAHNGHAEEYAIAKRLLDNLVAPYFVLAGNRDSRRELIKTFADGRFLRSDMPYVQYAVEHFPARLIVIDTVSENNRKGRLCQWRLADIGRMLAADTTRPAALFLHHPPFDVTVAPEPFQFEEFADVEALMAEVGQHRHVHGVFCGHIHREFETTVESMRASVVSSVASDVRWDKPVAAEAGLPVLKTLVVPVSTSC